MPIKMLYWIGLLLYLSSVFVCVHGQPTSDLYNSDDNNGHQVAFMEQTLHTLLTMSTRLDSVESQLDTLQTMKVQLQSMENRLESVEKRQRSIGQWVQGNSRDTRCKWSVDGNRTCYKLVHEKMTWSESRTNCQNLGDGADLVSIESQEENEFLIEMIRELRQRGCSGILTSGRRDSSVFRETVERSEEEEKY
ncbi:hypothetical protein LSAT2_018347 [Lamellibrachia satsuma]|nr:hypothetical protein LSAT2_018347 [Lamellibrachia satsuma]